MVRMSVPVYDSTTNGRIQYAGVLPILRSAKDDPDEENTLATALFELNLNDGSVQLQIFDREHSLPVRTLTVCPEGPVGGQVSQLAMLYPQEGQNLNTRA